MGGSTSGIAGLDAQALTDAVLGVAEGTVLSIVGFDVDSFEMWHVAEETQGFYRDEEQMLAHFERIHGYVNLDFMEIELFTQDLVPVADRVRFLTTALDAMKVVRVYLDDEGVFLALEHDEPVEPIASAIETQLSSDG